MTEANRISSWCRRPTDAAAVLLALMALIVSLVVCPARALAVVDSGALSQQGEACVGEQEEEVAKCSTTVRHGLSYAYQVELSPDGRYAYSVSVKGDLIEYQRNLVNGALHVIGCFGEEEALKPCAEEHAEMEVATAGGPAAIAISPDGSNVYIVSQLNDSVAEFARDASTGLLTKIGCITEESVLSECLTTDAKGLNVPYGITVSPDGQNVYVASFADKAVAEFKRSPEGGLLTQLEAPNRLH